jgi:hypothetical protein
MGKLSLFAALAVVLCMMHVFADDKGGQQPGQAPPPGDPKYKLECWPACALVPPYPTPGANRDCQYDYENLNCMPANERRCEGFAWQTAANAVCKEGESECRMVGVTNVDIRKGLWQCGLFNRESTDCECLWYDTQLQDTIRGVQQCQ